MNRRPGSPRPVESALGANCLTDFVQAITFAVLHYLKRFLNGLAGVALLLVYGGLLAGIRRFSGGMLAPLITHAAADLTIFTIVVVVNFQ